MHACGLSIITEQLQSSLDVDVGRIKVSCSLISIHRVCGLVVTRLILDTVSIDMEQGCARGKLTRVPRSYQTSEI